MRFIFTFILFLSLLGAEESGSSSFIPSLSSDNNFPISNIEGDPSAIVVGCVNVITGDYFDMQCDLVMVGGEPLTVERCYSSSDTSRGNLSYGWHFNLQGSLYCAPDKQLYVLKGAFGSEMRFDDPYKKKARFHSNMFRKGFTNNSKGIISGKTNLKNYSLSTEPISTRTYKLSKGDGSFFSF